MRTLVIPDVHQRIRRVELALHKEDYDEAIFLGDWLDSFVVPPYVSSSIETCEFLLYLLTKHPRNKDFIFLVGNHDLPYIYHNTSSDLGKKGARIFHPYPCPGFTIEKALEFKTLFYQSGLEDSFFKDRFCLAYQSQGFTFSHAGIVGEHLSYGESLTTLVNEILPQVWNDFRNLNNPKNYLLSDVGVCRGGDAHCGSPLWLDANQEFFPSPDIGPQIFGHTRGKIPQCFAPSSPYESWCLDTATHYGIVEDGLLELKTYAELRTPTSA